ncbi:MAG: hypothetical protein RIR12_1767 [Bacteroidota bacterium]|jgi:hypothetical protein
MTAILKSGLGKDYDTKRQKFNSLVSEIETENSEALKEIENNTNFKNYYLLKYHYTLIGPTSESNKVVFKFTENSTLPDNLKTQLHRAFEIAFE